MQAIFDIGANDGAWGLDVARRLPQYNVFAFEPTPKLCDSIRKRAISLKLANYELIEVAVSDIEGPMKFNVAGQADWGCSSLLEFSNDLDKTWPGRTDFQITEVIDVRCIRLERFVSERGISQIEFLHCDAQGADLKVLSSLGPYIDILQRGEIEAATSQSVVLYKEQHTIEDVVVFFIKNNFMIDRMTPNDIHYNEVNIQFKKRFT
jgi:FkbM family methyltransferase